MEHTDFYTLIENIKRQEYEELLAAIHAHGGSYEWPSEDEGSPVISVYTPDIISISVKKVYVKDETIHIDGYDCACGSDIQLNWDDVLVDDLPLLIEYIPPTEQVHSVKTNSTDNG